MERGWAVVLWKSRETSEWWAVAMSPTLMANLFYQGRRTLLRITQYWGSTQESGALSDATYHSLSNLVHFRSIRTLFIYASQSISVYKLML